MNMEEKKENKEKISKKKDQSKEEIKRLEDSLKEYEEKLKYSQAELINYRKRKDEETSNLLKFANRDLILEILPVLDNFERAIKLDENGQTEEVTKFLEGFKLIYTSLIETLKRYGVEEIEALGKEFDPNFQEALMVGNDETKPNGEVLEVLLKGYLLKGKVLRPATVKINQIEEKKGE